MWDWITIVFNDRKWKGSIKYYISAKIRLLTCRVVSILYSHPLRYTNMIGINHYKVPVCVLTSHPCTQRNIQYHPIWKALLTFMAANSSLPYSIIDCICTGNLRVESGQVFRNDWINNTLDSKKNMYNLLLGSCSFYCMYCHLEEIKTKNYDAN